MSRRQKSPAREYGPSSEREREGFREPLCGTGQVKGPASRQKVFKQSIGFPSAKERHPAPLEPNTDVERRGYAVQTGCAGPVAERRGGTQFE